MTTLITNISSLVTVNAAGKNFKSGSDMQDIGEIKNGAMIFDRKIKWIGSVEQVMSSISNSNFTPDNIIDAKGKTVLPGFVDSHTHIVFGGNRSSEFARRLKGVSYKRIAEEGGGILTTVRGTRDASVHELVETGKRLAGNAMKNGTTALEIKSGYGLSLESEIKLLKSIKILKSGLPVHISPTFLGAHDFPPEFRNKHHDYINLICNDMIPAVVEQGLAEFCDAFIDEGYFTLEEGERVLKAGLENGLKLKVHCDELAGFGSTNLAAKLGAVSADHLLFVSDDGIAALKKSGTVATLLPGTAYNIRLPYAPARKLIDRGCIVALATDCNPGSCFTENMQVILSLAVTNMNMSAEEAITAATLNGAAALCQSEQMGSLEIGKLANFIIADVTSYTDLFYHFGINHVEQTWVNGSRVI